MIREALPCCRTMDKRWKKSFVVVEGSAPRIYRTSQVDVLFFFNFTCGFLCDLCELNFQTEEHRYDVITSARFRKVKNPMCMKILKMIH
jgi:hypothetical protein